jgi:predicted transglutaminase-like cysteine proteinase
VRQRTGLIPASLLLVVSVALAQDSGFSEQRLQQIEREFGQPARARVSAWRHMIAAAEGFDEERKLELVNDFFNRIEFVDDAAHWGMVDYWATPLETLTSNGGDCEDLSIAKYFALRELGVADERLRLTYVKALDINQAHMVLTYFPAPDADPLVLDNLIGEIRPAVERPDLLPVYSFNGDGLWRNLLNRMRERVNQDRKPDTGSDSGQTR